MQDTIKTRPSIECMVEEMQKEIRNWGSDFKSRFFLSEYASDQNTLHDWHHTLGLYIRNRFRLWDYEWKVKIIDGFDDSPEHPDAVSMAVIEELWKQGPINVKKDT